MKINKNKLQSIIKESIRSGMFGGKPVVKNTHADKIKTQLSSFDRSFIIQSYELCDLMPDLDFQQIVRSMVADMLDDGDLHDRIHGDVSNLATTLHGDKLNTFYIEDENIESDVQMEFVFKTITDITKNLEDYYVEYFTAIGQGK
tara:strand:- start:60 stop:494 length:435 start_codon:yes stop_codon:yes gene_type:complete